MTQRVRWAANGAPATPVHASASPPSPLPAPAPHRSRGVPPTLCSRRPRLQDAKFKAAIGAQVTVLGKGPGGEAAPAILLFYGAATAPRAVVPAVRRR